MTLEHFDTIFAFVVILAGVSLLVTVLVQMASALVSLRGSNLRWGLKTLLTHADPELAGHAKTIAQKVLHHPLISDSAFSSVLPRLLSRWRLATAIRKDELLEILRVLAAQPATAHPKGAPVTWDAALRRSLDRLVPADVEKLMRAVPKVQEVFADDPAMSARVIAPLLTAAQEMPAKVEQWFDSVLDRVSQRFVVHTRLWTVIFSFVLALALHLDAFRLLTQLSTDAELRARLVSSADALTKKADETLAPPATTSAALYVEAMKQLISEHPAELGAIGEPSGFSNLANAKAWLARQLEAASVQEMQPSWSEQYEATVSTSSLRTSLDDLRGILKDKLKFQLIPDPYPQPFYNYWTPNWLHLWGIVASAALLSMGAPFWFNMLKTLANLRPVVANKQKEEREKNSPA